MNLSEPISAYCERLGPGLLAEPFNALSNFAFFYAAWRLYRVSADADAAIAARLRWLAALITLVGAGSLVFHTVATSWASVLDVVFIGVFNVAFLVIFLRTVADWPWSWSGAAGLAFIAFDRVVAMLVPGEAFNGSLLYLPATLVLIALTAYALAVARPAGRMMAGAAMAFALSILLRSLDRALCPVWPWGTHFAWHLINAWVLYRLSVALLLAAQSPGRGADPG
jgi:hypothetical protein